MYTVMTTVVKIVSRSVDQKAEIRAYIKTLSNLGFSLKQLMTELSTANGPTRVFHDTVRCWKNNFESGVKSIKNAPKPGRPKFASRKVIVNQLSR